MEELLGGYSQFKNNNINQEYKMTNMTELFGLNTNRLESDWDDLYTMLDDIKAYVQKTGDIVLNADDPGYHHNPPRGPRIGFVSESGKEWTIRLATISRQGNSAPEHWKNLRTLLKTSDGRRKLADVLNGKIENDSSEDSGTNS